jgi:hypothetical protein
MRRITRRIGLFGPGAFVKASGAQVRKPSAGPSAPAPSPSSERAEAARTDPPEKKSWLSRLFFGDEEG